MGGINPVIAILMGKLWPYQGGRGGGVAAKGSHPIFFFLQKTFLSHHLSTSPPLLPFLPSSTAHPPPLVWQCPVLDGEIGGTTRSNDPSHSTTKFLGKFKAGQLMDRLAVLLPS